MYLRSLKISLAGLRRQGLIREWHDREIIPGEEWEESIDENLATAEIILPLVSPSFINSDYAFEKEMKRALERHERGEARVIPVIVRPTDWEWSPLAKLQALPKNAKPITTWPNADEAWLDVVRGIRKAIERPAGQPITNEWDVGRRIERYERAYYDQLRRAMSRYPTILDSFPYFFKGCNHMVIVLGSDGVVVIHREAEQDSFEFRDRSNQRVADIISGPDIEVHAEAEYTYPEDEGPSRWKFFSGHFEMETGELARADEWLGFKLVEVIPGIEIDAYDEDSAKEQAESDVATFVNAHIMGVQVEQEQPAETRDRVSAELEAAINEFEMVLARDLPEETLQQYLSIERNRILLEPSAVTITPQVSISTRYVADFVVEVPGQRYVLVEIERATCDLFTRNDNFSAAVNNALGQVEQWINLIRDHPSQFRDETMLGIREPQGWVIIGRRNNMTDRQQRLLEGRNARLRDITIFTYDDLLNKARQHLRNLRELST
jgi:hypothetical protein